MAEILILTILGAFAGLYSLLPQYKQLRIRYAPSRKTKIALGALGSLIILLSLIQSFLQYNYENHITSVWIFYSSTFFLIEAVQLLATLIIVGIFLNVLVIGSVTISNTEFFNDRMRELLNRGDYSTVVTLLNEHYAELFHTNSDSFSELLDTIDTLLQERGIIEEIARYHPRFALRVLKDEDLDAISRTTFTYRYFEELLKNDSSIFYREIWNSRDFTSGHHRYRLKEENRLLTTIFRDCEIAKELAVYRPVGEWIIAYLKEQGRMDYDDYNDFDINFGHDVNRSTFRDPVVASVHFFDVMISESLYQGIEWHMWLYYYAHITEQICENFEVTDNTDPSNEFPNRYGYILTEIMWNLRHWIECAERDRDELDLRLEHADCRHENGDIVKSSLRCLARCGRVISTTEEIPRQFVQQISRDIYIPYFEMKLSNDSLVNEYAEAYVDCLEDQMDNMPNGDEFRGVLFQQLGHIRNDSIARSRVLYRDGGTEAVDELRDRIQPEF